MATREQLEQLFRERGINFADPGFYDLPAFQRCEREDSRFLENYAEYIHLRSFDRNYLDRARPLILDLANFLATELRADGRKGACIDASGAMMRMLEREGVWSCMVGGAAIVSFPPETGLNPRYFWPIVHPDNLAKTGHMWLFAPPFKVVDITLFMQDWNQRQAEHIPDVIAVDQWQPAQTDIGDLMEDELVELILKETRRAPTMENVGVATRLTMQKLAPFSISIADARVKYVPAQTSAMDGALEQMRNLQLRGRYPAELYRRFLERRNDRVAQRP